MKITDLPNEIIFNILSFQSFETSDGIKTLCSLQSITKEFYNKNELFNDQIWKEIFENKFLNQNKFFFKTNDLNEINKLTEIIKQNYKYYYSIINHYISLKFEQKVKNNKKNKNYYNNSVTNQEEEHKIVVIGEGGNGKSSITIRFIQNVFVYMYDPTIEDSYRKIISIDNKQSVIDILDTANSYEYSALRDLYFRLSKAIIYVCSINSKSSLESLEYYFDLFLRIKDTNIYPCVLCVNKIDLPESEHQITKEMVDEFLDEMIKKEYLLFKCPIFFTSAKDGVNINEMFEEIVRLCRIDYSLDMFDLMKRVISDEKKVFKDFNKLVDSNKKCLLQ